MFLKTYVIGEGLTGVTVAVNDYNEGMLILEDLEAKYEVGAVIGVNTELPENCTVLVFSTLERAVEAGNAIVGKRVFDHLLEH